MQVSRLWVARPGQPRRFPSKVPLAAEQGNGAVVFKPISAVLVQRQKKTNSYIYIVVWSYPITIFRLPVAHLPNDFAISPKTFKLHFYIYIYKTPT